MLLAFTIDTETDLATIICRKIAAVRISFARFTTRKRCTGVEILGTGTLHASAEGTEIAEVNTLRIICAFNGITLRSGASGHDLLAQSTEAAAHITTIRAAKVRAVSVLLA